MADAIPHFRRCSWCGCYFEMDAADIEEVSADEQLLSVTGSAACCPSCARELALFHSEAFAQNSATFDLSQAPNQVPNENPTNSAELTARKSEPKLLGKHAADGQGKGNVWLRCPICHKALYMGSIIPQAKNYSPLQIHLEHIRAEKKQSLLQQCRQLELLNRGPEVKAGEPIDTSQLLDREGYKPNTEPFLLRNWYPKAINCDKLFWYSYALQ